MDSILAAFFIFIAATVGWDLYKKKQAKRLDFQVLASYMDEVLPGVHDNGLGTAVILVEALSSHAALIEIALKKDEWQELGSVRKRIISMELAQDWDGSSSCIRVIGALIHYET